MNLNVRKRLFFLSLCVVCILALSIPHILRLNSFLAGDESYLYLKLSENILETNKIPEKSFSPITLSLIPAILSNLLNIPLLYLFKYLPLLFGLLSFIFFYKILEEIKLDFKTRVISSLVLFASPAFIYLFFIYNPYFFPIFFLLSGFYFLLKNQKIVSLIFLSLTSFFNISGVLIMLSLIFIYCYNPFSKKKSKLFFLWLFLINLILFIPNNFHKLKHISIFLPQNNLIELISEFGGQYGFSLFLIFLVIFGFNKLWSKKYYNLLIYITIFFLVILSVYFLPAIFYLNLILVCIAALGFKNLIEKKWESPLIKKFTIYIIILGLIFSGLSFANRLSDLKPNFYVMNTMDFLKNKINDEIVLSHYSYGHWISYSNNKNILDSNFLYKPNIKERVKDTETIFKSKELEDIRYLIKKYEIKYIWLNKEMKNGLIWENDEEGLSFLTKYHKETFKKVYVDKENEVFEVRI